MLLSIALCYVQAKPGGGKKGANKGSKAAGNPSSSLFETSSCQKLEGLGGFHCDGGGWGALVSEYPPLAKSSSCTGFCKAVGGGKGKGSCMKTGNTFYTSNMCAPDAIAQGGTGTDVTNSNSVCICKSKKGKGGKGKKGKR